MNQLSAAAYRTVNDLKRESRLRRDIFFMPFASVARWTARAIGIPELKTD